MSYRIETQHRKGARWRPLTARFPTVRAAQEVLDTRIKPKNLIARIAEYDSGLRVRVIKAEQDKV